MRRLKTSHRFISLLPLPDGVHALAVCSGSHQIWKVNLETGDTKVYVGQGERGKDDGQPHKATFDSPCSLAMKANGSVLVVDRNNNLIRKISQCGNFVITIAGDRSKGRGYTNGDVKTAQFNCPNSICVGPDGSIYIADGGNHCIRKISGDTVSTIAGVPGTAGYRDGAGNQALFDTPLGIDIDDHGNIYVSDWMNKLIRKIDPSGNVTRVTGQQIRRFRVDGNLNIATFHYPHDIHVDGSGNILVADLTSVRYVNLSSNTVSTITGHEESDLPEDNINTSHMSGCYTVCLDLKGNIMTADYLEANNANNRLIIVPHTGGVSSHIQRISVALSPNKPNPLLIDLTKMFSNAKSFESNVTFSVNGVDIPAHRSILMARSEYFQNMFSGGYKESTVSSTTSLPVHDTTPETFESLLMYLYTGDADKVVNGANVFDLIDLANRYGVTYLENYCLWFIESNMNESTAIELLLWSSNRAEMGLYMDLRGKVKTYVLDHLDSIKENHRESFELLNKAMLMELLLNSNER